MLFSSSPTRKEAGNLRSALFLQVSHNFSRILILAFQDFFQVFQGYCDFSSFPGRVGTLCKQHKIFGLRIWGGQLKIHQFNFVFKTINLQHPTHKENFKTLASDCTYMTIVHWTVIKLVDGGIVRPIQSHRFHLEVFAVVVRQIGAAGWSRRVVYRLQISRQRHYDVRVLSRPMDDHLVMTIIQFSLKKKSRYKFENTIALYPLVAIHLRGHLQVVHGRK